MLNFCQHEISFALFVDNKNRAQDRWSILTFKYIHWTALFKYIRYAETLTMCYEIYILLQFYTVQNKSDLFVNTYKYIFKCWILILVSSLCSLNSLKGISILTLSRQRLPIKHPLRCIWRMVTYSVISTSFKNEFPLLEATYTIYQQHNPRSELCTVCILRIDPKVLLWI